MSLIFPFISHGFSSMRHAYFFPMALCFLRVFSFGKYEKISIEKIFHFVKNRYVVHKIINKMIPNIFLERNKYIFIFFT